MERNPETVHKSVQWFAEQMEQKLKENAHKGHWKHSRNSYLLMRLKEEFYELADAICTELPANEIIRECADVANFAMFIADNIKLSR